jgi:phage replication O-like protein O
MRVLIPNSTQIPDILLDLWMAELSGSEFKVLLYIARRTYGFGKEWDTISLNQISNGIKKRDGTVLDYGTGVSRASVIRALNTLESKRIIIRQTNKRGDSREYDENTYSINLGWEQSQKKSGSGSGGGNQGGGLEQRRNSPREVVSKRDYLVSKRDQVDSKSDQRWSQNETRVVSKLDPQETDLQETAARAETVTDNAAAALIERLVLEGVGRSVATDLVRRNPKACELQLEYLPFAEVRKSKGAWLACAIRSQYGPPEKYLKEQERKRLQALPQKTSSRVECHNEARKVQLGKTAYARISKVNPETIDAFKLHLQNEKERAALFSKKLTDTKRNEYLAHLESEEYLIDQFTLWLTAKGLKQQHQETVP